MTAQSCGWGEGALRELLGSDARARVVSHVFMRPGDGPIIGLHVARELGLAPNAVWLELERLCRIGVLHMGERVGRVKPYYLNRESPLLPGLRSLVLHTAGAAAVLSAELANRDDVDVAFIYGSVAAGSDGPDSDVDLFVIGQIDGLDLSGVCSDVETRLGREVEAVHWAPDDLAQQMTDPSSFLSSVMRQPKLFVKGDEDGLRRVAGR